MTKIALSGAAGRIGKTICATLIGRNDFEILFGVDARGGEDFPFPVHKSFDDCPAGADVVIDFSVPEALDGLLSYCLKNKCGAVIATTGHTAEQLAAIKKASESVPVFMASNMSLGVNLLAALAKDAAKFLGSAYDVEIVETHHNRKLDSPSGTALTLAAAINDARGGVLEPVYGRHAAKHRREPNEIGIHAVRGGTVVGKHDIFFLGAGEVIRLSHESESKEVFAMGALRAAEFIAGKEKGFYDMTSILGDFHAVTAVECERDVALVTLPSASADEFLALLSELKRLRVNLDMISRNYLGSGSAAVSFTLSGSDLARAEKAIAACPGAVTVRGACKLTAEGAGMQHKSGVAADVLSLLAGTGACIYAVTTSETKISCCIDSASLATAEKALKSYYGIK